MSVTTVRHSRLLQMARRVRKNFGIPLNDVRQDIGVRAFARRCASCQDERDGRNPRKSAQDRRQEAPWRSPRRHGAGIRALAGSGRPASGFPRGEGRIAVKLCLSPGFFVEDLVATVIGHLLPPARFFARA